MELTYQLNKNVNRVLCLDNASAVQSGIPINISNSVCCMLIVEGDFEGRIIPILKAQDIKLSNVYSDFLDSNGKYVSYITSPGVYYVNMIAGYTYCIPRLEKYTSGSVTVVGVAITDGVNAPRPRNHVIKKINKTVEVGGTYTDSGVDLTAYPFHYITIYADSAHQFEVVADYTVNGLSQGYGLKNTFIFSSNGNQRGCCEWQEAKGEKFIPKIINHDTQPHTYELCVYGVR